jgi:hypothetical protein
VSQPTPRYLCPNCRDPWICRRGGADDGIWRCVTCGHQWLMPAEPEPEPAVAVAEPVSAFGRIELDDGDILEVASEHRTDGVVDVVIRYPDPFGDPVTLRLSPGQAADLAGTLMLVLAAAGWRKHEEVQS